MELMRSLSLYSTQWRQATNIDDHLEHLPAVSRSTILQRCQQLMDGQNPSFRGYRAAALAKRLFQIQLTLPNGKRRMKTALEFGEVLMCYLGRRSDRSMEGFRSV